MPNSVICSRVLALSCLILTVGCDTREILQKPEWSLERMIEQPRYNPYESSPVFEDGKVMRRPPVGTVRWDPAAEGTVGAGAARGTASTSAILQGMEAEQFVVRIPLAVTLELLQRGQDRFNIFCAPCHGDSGDGVSAVARNMSLRRPPSLIANPVRSYPAGRIFRVIRQGYGLMASYEAQLSIEDAWAVVAYVQALELSQGVNLAELPADLQTRAIESLGAKEMPK